ncbi:glucosidase 2 subunit beta isoform X1 [Aplysia californica]|uniref:Glucosidase 2 subunit beta n=1 Tax=Aplysia californica TaxID=6500 RepID=A0ABM0JBW4_APLCA|nr:glucosidase 2 subunit beta isoform X1 [Aplysia californica]
MELPKGLLTSVFVFLSLLSFSFAVGRPRGVSLEKASFYEGGTEFKCLSNGRIIPMDHVNDDYCDCEDGSDEPGTSACSNGLFYCENKPYKGSYIMSSRVNDGICDCCDGSDEYDGTISCENTCEKLFAEIRAQQEAFREKQEQGYKVKLEYIQKGKRAKDEKVARLSELERTKETLVQVRNGAEELKNAAEEPEKEAKDKHEAAWNAVKEERRKAKEAVVAGEAFAELDVNQDGIVDIPELQNHQEFDIDSDGTVSDEEAKEYLEDSDSCDLPTFTEKIWPNIKEIYKPPSPPEEVPAGEGEEATAAPVEEQPEGSDPRTVPPILHEDVKVVEGGSKEEEDKYRYSDDEDLYNDEDDEEEEDDELEDEDDLEADYDISKKRRGRRNKSEKTEGEDDEEKMPDYDEETKKLIAVADEARNNYNDADRKVRDMETEITGIKSYMELDFGPEEEFAALKGQCFEYTDREYTYKLCPFEKTSQRPKAGGMETSLGNWGHWHGPAEDKYDAMKYENGQGCWNGPSRTCHVNFHCGAENALTGASEPSRCEYQFEFTTPARCAAPDSREHAVHEEL